MITALQQYESLTAIGILARAALSIDDDGNPAAEVKLPNESSIRRAILNEIRENLGIGLNDVSEYSLERLGDALDEELTKLTDKTDDHDILSQLADKGELPSDLYEPTLISNLRGIYEKHWYLIQDNIFETIRKADREQHFAPAADTKGEAPLVSFFAKNFQEKNPQDNFTMFLVGQRQGLKLEIHQAWRLYTSDIKFSGTKNLFELLERFTEVYGVEFDLNGKKTKFIVNSDLGEDQDSVANINIVKKIKTDRKGKKSNSSMNIIISHFVGKRENGTTNSTFTVAIDVDKYLASLELHGW
jgi:hypothetical protein